MSKIYLNPSQLEDFVDAALGIQERFGIGKALGYVIGEKFYNLVDILHFNRTMERQIEEKRKKPNYNPIVDRSTKEYRVLPVALCNLGADKALGELVMLMPTGRRRLPCNSRAAIPADF